MILLAFNGSPRRKWNTATLLRHAMEGAESEGAKTALFNLYDMDYTGCTSCFACKRIGGKNYGHCPVRDDLKPVFRKIEKADAILIGSPIYYGVTTGMTRCFLERLIFQYSVYDPDRTTLFQKMIRTGFIYTANATEERVKELGYNHCTRNTEKAMEWIFGSCDTIWVTDTYQFSDYGKYLSTRFNVAEKKQRREEQFPVDCNRAFDLGSRLIRAEE